MNNGQWLRARARNCIQSCAMVTTHKSAHHPNFKPLAHLFFGLPTIFTNQPQKHQLMSIISNTMEPKSKEYAPIQVVNKRQLHHLHGGKNVYIGRGNRHMKGSPLGNPFKMKCETDRDYVVEQYDAWLTNEMKNQDSPARKELYRLVQIAQQNDSQRQPMNLICWCAPKRCHGDIVKMKILNELSSSFCQPTTITRRTESAQGNCYQSKEGKLNTSMIGQTNNSSPLRRNPNSNNAKKPKRKKSCAV